MASANSDTFTSSLQIWRSLFLILVWLLWVAFSMLCLNGNGEDRHACNVSNLRGEMSSFSPLSIISSVGLSKWLLICFNFPLFFAVVIIFQFSSVAQSCLTVCDPMNRSTPGLPVHRQLPEFTQTHVHRVSDAIQPSHPLSSPSPSAPNPSQHQSLFQWVNSSNEVAKVLEFQL